MINTTKNGDMVDTVQIIEEVGEVLLMAEPVIISASRRLRR